MPQEKNLKYRMKYRPNYAAVKGRYKSLPPPMAGDPPEAKNVNDWDKRCRIIYQHMIALKQGIVPEFARRGLWFHSH